MLEAKETDSFVEIYSSLMDSLAQLSALLRDTYSLYGLLDMFLVSVRQNLPTILEKSATTPLLFIALLLFTIPDSLTLRVLLVFPVFGDCNIRVVK